jgi:molybdate transport system substrate-binding protein
VRRLSAAAAAGVLVLLAAGAGAGCGSDSGSPGGGGTSGASGTSEQNLTVFAAASLKSTFTTLGQQFEEGHTGTKVAFNFAGSADLVTQLQQGAPADVFASADTKNMTKATGDDLVDGTPTAFASNTLEIAVPPDNPAGVASFADLARPGVKVVVCAAAVPCGSAAEKIETASGIGLRPVSEETSVTDVLNKVQTGEADAGLVYVTDIRSAGAKVTGIPFPESKEAVNQYPIATLTGSKNQTLAKQFIELVTGPEGQRVLAGAGFAKP